MDFSLHVFIVLQSIFPIFISGLKDTPLNDNPIFLNTSDLSTITEKVNSTDSANKNQDVSVNITGLYATLDNGLIKIEFQEDASASSLYYKNGKDFVNNVNKLTFILDWNQDETFNTYSPSELQIIENTSERVHIMYLENNPKFLKIELHYIMLKGLSGIYTYVKTTNILEESVTFPEMRVLYRFDPETFYKISNSQREGITPLQSELDELPLVQDTTWLLPDGKIYSKYDYAGYLRETPYQGVFGNGYGSWLISPSREYHSGGPLKQDLIVHQDSLILNYLSGAHFGTPETIAPEGWSKLYGPWLLYFNEGSDDEEVKADVMNQVELESEKWPYKWMNDLDYPLERATVIGKVYGPSKSMLVLSSSLEEDFDLQTLGYVFYSETTGENGEFQLQNVRPGEYKLIIYPLSGYGIGVVQEMMMTIDAGLNDVGILNLDVPKEVKWSVGETNRRSDKYQYSNESRNYIWQTKPPADLEFEIGKSVEERDWYYAQTKEGGVWSIRYQDEQNGKDRLLRIGLAAVSQEPNLAVYVNDELIETITIPFNDKAIYRGAMQSGNYYTESLFIPREVVRGGDNVLSFELVDGLVMYDSVNFSDN